MCLFSRGGSLGMAVRIIEINKKNMKKITDHICFIFLFLITEHQVRHTQKKMMIKKYSELATFKLSLSVLYIQVPINRHFMKR